MSLYTSIDRGINSDAWFRGLSEGAQHLFLRLLIGPQVTPVPGLWRATEWGLAAEFKLPIERFRERFQELSQELSRNGLPRVLADWDAGVIWLPNSLNQRCNQPANPNVLKGWIVHLELVPECPLKDQALQHFQRWVETQPQRFPKGLPNGFPNGSANGSEGVSAQEQEQEQEQDPPPPPQVRARGNPPGPRRDLLHAKVQAKDWQPQPEARDYATELGLADDEWELTLLELRDKHGLRPHDLPWWDTKLNQFLEQRARQKKQSKHPPKSTRRVQRGGYTPPKTEYVQ